MDVDFFNSFQDLCNSPVANSTEAEAILDLLAEIILNELHARSSSDCDPYYDKFVYSFAYRLDLRKSRALIVRWLEQTDLLQKQWLTFLGHVLAKDLQRCTDHLRSSETALQVIIDVIWTYRFTEFNLVQKYLIILYEYFAHAQLDEQALENCVSDDLINYLYRAVCERTDDESNSLAWESMLVLIALNDQYMLHDWRGSQNKVFHLLESSPNRYIEIGSSLVLLFNRCGEHEQNLKIFIAKFFYLVFTTPSTTEFLYTNDLDVLAEVLIRELNDLCLDAVDVRAMYLRLMYVMTKNSTIKHTNPKLRSVVVQVLRLTLNNANNLDSEEDRSEIIRLANRCLSVEWLQWSNCDEDDDEYDVYADGNSYSNEDGGSSDERNNMPSPQMEFFTRMPTYNSSHTSLDIVSHTTQKEPTRDAPTDLQIEMQSPQTDIQAHRPKDKSEPIHLLPRPQRRRPPPPPPPRTHVNASSVSIASIDKVDHLRPPPPPQRKRS